GQYVIKVNNRKVLDGVMEAIDLGGEGYAARRLTVLRAIDKLDRLGVDGVKLLLGSGRKDESGDFTKGAGLTSKEADFVINATSSEAQGAGRREIEFKGRPWDDMAFGDDLMGEERRIDNFGTLVHWAANLGLINTCGG